MQIEYHPAVRQDVGEAALRYNAVSRKLAVEFKEELHRIISKAAENPNRFPAVRPRFHRANLRRFPYHVIYREIPAGIRVTLVRHHRRHPDVGIERD
jgi:hypothetical protein